MSKIKYNRGERLKLSIADKYFTCQWYRKIKIFRKKKIHCLTGKTPVSIEDFFLIFHALTGKRPVSNTNWLH